MSFRSEVMKRTLVTLLAVYLSGCSVVGIRTAEELQYQIVDAVGDFEIRRYQDFVVAETSTEGSFDGAQDKTFQKLFRYIQGNNDRKESISMTTPVEVGSDSEISSRSHNEGGRAERWTMSFMLPSTYRIETAPQPKDEQVSIRSIKQRTVAVARFTGRWTGENYDIHKANLFRWLEERRIPYIKESVRIAAFDPPWTLPMLRRNEVHVDLAPTAVAD